jgi:hypothetical protein
MSEVSYDIGGGVFGSDAGSGSGFGSCEAEPAGCAAREFVTFFMLPAYFPHIQFIL